MAEWVIDTEGCIYVAINRINDTPVLTKWSPDGVCLWQQNLDIYQGTFYQVVVSDSNEVYTVGESSQDNTAIIVKWSTEATGPIWQRRLDNFGRIYFTDVTIDTTGNIIAVGQIYYYGSWACGLLTKWSADGNLLWKKYVGGAKCCGVCTDSKNNIYCSGYYGTDTYVAMLFCLRSTGSAKWGRYLNNPVSNQEMFSLYDIVIDTDNNIYTVGGIKDTAYVLQWDSRGELQWEKAINCPDGYSFTQAVADDLGGIYAAGFCVTAINIAGDGFGVLPMLTQYSWDEVDLTINSAKPGLYSLSNTSSVGTWDSVVLNLPIVELTIDLPSSTY